MSDNQKLERRIEAIEGLDLAGLQAEYRALFGVDPVTKNLKVLRTHLTRKLQRMAVDARKKAAAKGGSAATEAPTPEPATITDRLAALTEMNLAQLRERFKEVYGWDSLSRDRRHLIKKIAEKIQANAAEAATPAAAAIPQPTLTVPLATKRQANPPRRAGGKKAKVAKGPVEDKSATARAKARLRDPRLPKPGTVIERQYKGKRLLVTVREDGFEYQGKPFRSLSALAKHISGSIVNGFVWWGLGLPEQRRKKSK